MAAITRLDLYTADESAPRASLHYTDAGRAEDARRELLADDGLSGIDRIEVVTVLTDDDAEQEFYESVAFEALI